MLEISEGFRNEYSCPRTLEQLIRASKLFYVIAVVVVRLHVKNSNLIIVRYAIRNYFKLRKFGYGVLELAIHF